MNEIIVRALTFAAFKHRHQKRKSAENIPYINHPLDVLSVLRVEAGVDDAAILCAAILHDTIEDTETSFDELVTVFGAGIAALVAEVTDDKTLPKQQRKDLQIAHAPHASFGAKHVKLADKIANVRDMCHAPPANWPFERRWEYLDWSERVVAGLRDTHAGLEDLFDAAMARARILLRQGE